MNSVLNISGYRFVEIGDPHALRERLLLDARALGLLGTILLAEEGINLFLAADEAPLREFLSKLGTDARFAGMQFKESWSAAQPFRKLLVKIKREIIRMNHPAMRPHDGRAPALDARTAARWLEQGHDDEGRPVVALDTRNAFEVEHGTFEGAIDWRLAKFSDFPDELDAHKAEFVGLSVFCFCSGGFRCVFVVLFLRVAGLSNVWQLEGGILKYFEEAGSAHFRGECFVFDERVALDTSLRTAAPAE